MSQKRGIYFNENCSQILGGDCTSAGVARMAGRYWAMVKAALPVEDFTEAELQLMATVVSEGSWQDAGTIHGRLSHGVKAKLPRVDGKLTQGGMSLVETLGVLDNVEEIALIDWLERKVARDGVGHE